MRQEAGRGTERRTCREGRRGIYSMSWKGIVGGYIHVQVITKAEPYFLCR